MFLKNLTLLVLFTISTFAALALADTTNIPVYRQYFHDKINNEQKLCDRGDGKLDNMFRVGNNEEVNLRISDVLFRKIDELQNWVEQNNAIEKNNDKIRYLGYIETELRFFRLAWKKKEITSGEFPKLIDNFTKILKSAEVENSLPTLLKDMPYSIAKFKPMFLLITSRTKKHKKSCISNIVDYIQMLFFQPFVLM